MANIWWLCKLASTRRLRKRAVGANVEAAFCFCSLESLKILIRVNFFLSRKKSLVASAAGNANKMARICRGKIREWESSGLHYEPSFLFKDLDTF